MSPTPFRFGTYIKLAHSKMRKDGKPRDQAKYLVVCSGPQRGQYVHVLIAEAVMGRKLEGDETVEHKNGDGLDMGDPPGDNLVVVSKGVNTRLRHIREWRERAKENGQEEIPWENQF